MQSQKKFIYCSDGSSVDLQLCNRHILVSAAMCWKNNKFRIPNFLQNAKSIMIDSGGYSFKDNGYPYTWQQYTEFVKQFKLKYPQTECFAVMDTFSNGIKTSEINKNYGAWEGLPVKPIMILQGNTVDDYLYCIQETKWDPQLSYNEGTLIEEDHRCPYEYGYYPGSVQHLEDPTFDETEFTYEMSGLIGIGNLAGRTDANEIYDILRACRNELDNEFKIHALGLKMKYFINHSIRHLIDQADSGVWRFGGKKRFPSNHAEKITNLNTFNKKLDALNSHRELSDFVLL